MKHANIAFFVPHRGCPNNCIFCDQKRISGSAAPLKPQDVIQTLDGIAPGTLDSEHTELAFFGGSFTAIPRGEMEALLMVAAAYRAKGLFKGIRISTRPDCVSEEILGILKEYGVTAVELGAQSTDDRVLAENGRGHTARDIADAAKRVSSFGFSLGLQMMTGLYGSTDETDIKTCRELLTMHPDTMRIYPTVVLLGTPLEALYRSGAYIPPSLGETVALCAKLKRLCDEQSVKVIRLGLHAGGDVAEGYVAGAYHPAFGELVESRLYLDAAMEKLSGFPPGAYTLTVAAREISKMTGQRKSNLAALGAYGYRCAVKGDGALSPYDIIINERSNTCT